MPTFRNEKYGFEMDLPDGWAMSAGLYRIPVILSNTIKRANILVEFAHGADEHLNIVVEPMMIPEPPPEINELVFTLSAQDMGYTDVEFGRILVGGRLHSWARYTMLSKVWLKKYHIILNGTGYAITASCATEGRRPACEPTWDKIAQSLRLLNPVDASITALSESPRGRRTLDRMRELLLAQIQERRFKARSQQR